MEVLQALYTIPGIGPVLPYLALGVAICSAMAPALPAPGANSGGWYQMLYGLVNFVALNFGHAKNKGAEEKAPVPPPHFVLALLALGLTLGACSMTQDQQLTSALGTSGGQLFCAISKNGVQIVAPIVEGAATAKGGQAAGAAAVLVVGQTAGWVQSRCDQAAQAVGGQGAIPVAPPPGSVQMAPVAVPKGA